MPGGRPSLISQVVRVRDDGTEITAAQQIVERVRLGMTLGRAAASAGVDSSTMHRWVVAGARIRASQAQGRLTTLAPHDEQLVEFCTNLERAEAETEANVLAVIQRAAQGGATTVKTTERFDHTGSLVERSTVTATLSPQWQAAAWLGERRFGYVRRYELTGAEGAPLVPQSEQARNLADSLRGYLEGAAAGAEAAAQVKASRPRKRAAKATAS